MAGCCIFEIAAHQPAFRALDMAGLISKINRSFISPLPTAYSSSLKRLIKSMLRKQPGTQANSEFEWADFAAELLRHPHLEPYVAQCHKLSPVFLPIKSELSCRDKPKGTGLASKFGTGKETKGTKATPPREFLFVWEENCHANDSNFETKLESMQKELPVVKEVDTEGVHTDHRKASELRRNNKDEHNAPRLERTLSARKTLQCGNSDGAKENGLALLKQARKSDIRELIGASSDSLMSTITFLQSEEMRLKQDPRSHQRAEALESLLEICANLLRQERLEDLAGVLRPFGEETVSSRETAIWLTKSLMNPQKNGTGGTYK
ncbi:hypothetical protein Patl1_29711 [Pistacia atlantica]|uniref:Uncharacterized protein n=1 Tax=Pistacia atlantica TaxID=434234 RepID=A0ACC1ABE2_9ROSI|nr:hypothetical protein Patl1_29711 [Pistacia atlantica]